MKIFLIASSIHDMLKDKRGILNKEIIGIVYDDLGDNWIKVQTRVEYEGSSHAFMFPGRGGLVGFRVYLSDDDNLNILWSQRPTDRQRMAVRDYLKEEYNIDTVKENTLFY